MCLGPGGGELVPDRNLTRTRTIVAAIKGHRRTKMLQTLCCKCGQSDFTQNGIPPTDHVIMYIVAPCQLPSVRARARVMVWVIGQLCPHAHVVSTARALLQT